MGNQPPFFCVHPVGSNVFFYKDLASQLGCEQPFYVLRSPSVSGDSQALTRIEDVAAHNIDALQTIQPQGPYQLGGWSLGGVVAFEMAQQLHSRGHEVALLALIDSYTPFALNLYKDIDEAMQVTFFARNLGGLFGKKLLLSVDGLRQLSLDEQLNHILEQAKKLNILPPEVGQQQMHQMFEVFKTNRQSMYCYIPQPYPSRITLLCASEKLVPVNQDSTQGWGKLAIGSLDIYEIPGDHYTIIRSQVLAEKLKACLDEAQTNL